MMRGQLVRPGSDRRMHGAQGTHGIQQVNVDLVCGEVANVPLTELDSTEDASDLRSVGWVMFSRVPAAIVVTRGRSSSSKRTKNMAQVNPRAK